MVAPHDKGIVAEVNAVPLGELAAFLEGPLTGGITLGREADQAYLAAAAQAAIDHDIIRRARLRTSGLTSLTWLPATRSMVGCSVVRNCPA